MSDAEYALRLQTEAARDLLMAIRATEGGDDDELLADAVEGQTGLTEALAEAIDLIDEDEVLIEGLRAKEKAFRDRRALIEQRVGRTRATIERAMVTVDMPTIKLPSATLSLSRRAPTARVDDESQIPSGYFIAQPAPAPKLDTKSLTAGLRARSIALADAAAIEDEALRAEALATIDKFNPPIPGASLDNGSVSLTVRRK